MIDIAIPSDNIRKKEHEKLETDLRAKRKMENEALRAVTPLS